ncbi:unnamed protein product [Toxocara canis]|uniref:DOMON domain-containing protein n=1 Tax=Toxocara canis TaxID=6265 RepID=A0A183TYT7_TOXCA|nr:unnamed protein product [Toxocara canis]
MLAQINVEWNCEDAVMNEVEQVKDDSAHLGIFINKELLFQNCCSSLSESHLSAATVAVSNNETFEGCEVNVTKDFWASWTVYDKSLKFDIRLDNLPFKDFWVGVGFTNISAEPGDRVDIVALTRTNGSLTMKVFSPKFYAEPTSLEETVQQAVTELLLCDVSAMCSNTITKAQSGDTAGNALTRQRRQVNPSNADLPSMYRPTVSINSPNFTAVFRRSKQCFRSSLSAMFADEACDRPDPYWCQSYVEEYMNWQFDFNHASMQIACSQLRDSLFYADNRCCQSVRARGC